MVAAVAGGADPYVRERERMVGELATVEGIRSPTVLEAMRAVPRHVFVAPKWRRWAYLDMALPIGHAQTLTPPSVVGYMTEQLGVRPADRVLEVGTGCGYQAAILGRLAKEVYTVEIVGALGRRARDTLRRLDVANVEVRIGDGYRGWPEKAPFDCILVTCSPESVPEPLMAQLAEGGRMIVPVGEAYRQVLVRFTKRGGRLEREALAPTAFVPMTGQADAARRLRLDPAHPALANGDFDQVDPETGLVAGWYHLKQAVREADGGVPAGGPCMSFENREPGRAAGMAQVLAVDGRCVGALRMRGWVRTAGVSPGSAGERHEIATVVIGFYDQDRAPLKQESLGDWRGTTEWRSFEGCVEVPAAAREAIVQIGLHGATGRLSVARLSLGSEPRAPAR